MPPADRPDRRLLTAELLSIGSELIVGETRDTNAGELARSLADAGVTVRRMTAVPDRLEAVTEAFADGLRRADLVVSTGGLGPTPDDLTREAIAAVCGETPVVDPALEAWLRGLWARRRLAFPELNLKQAWVIPSAEPLPNPNGTAPGWFVSRPDGRVAISLPGPPREMRPMWADHALPRLHDRGLGAEVASRTYRLTGIGESQVAEILGEELLRRHNPEVATYARAEAVDVRISAVSGPDGRAADLVAAVAVIVERDLGDHVWATGDTTWSGAIGARLAALGWRLALVESGTRGQVLALFGDVDWVASGRVLGGSSTTMPGDDGLTDAASAAATLLAEARAVRADAGVQVGLAVRAIEHGSDTTVDIAVVTDRREATDRRLAFQGGSLGRTRSALNAAAVLHEALRD